LRVCPPIAAEPCWTSSSASFAYHHHCHCDSHFSAQRHSTLIPSHSATLARQAMADCCPYEVWWDDRAASGPLMLQHHGCSRLMLSTSRSCSVSMQLNACAAVSDGSFSLFDSDCSPLSLRCPQSASVGCRRRRHSPSRSASRSALKQYHPLHHQPISVSSASIHRPHCSASSRSRRHSSVTADPLERHAEATKDSRRCSSKQERAHCCR
jgi:hypothetical protein